MGGTGDSGTPIDRRLMVRPVEQLRPNPSSLKMPSWTRTLREALPFGRRINDSTAGSLVVNQHGTRCKADVCFL